MTQYINSSNKENQINRPIIDSRTPLSTIKGGNINNPIKPSNKASNQPNPSLQNVIKLEHSLEDALKKIKLLEAQLKQKDVIISELKTQNQILVDSFSENEKTNSRINNNRIRKIQNLTLSNQTLQEKLEEEFFKNEKKDKINIIQNNNRIRLIHKLKTENNELKKNHHHNLHHQQNQVEQQLHHHEQLTINRSTNSSAPVEPAQSIKELIVPSQPISSSSVNYYGLEDYEEHVGEC
ncbi:expressed protein [Dictyostelium purpureum]|uniref:Expressed protein n=1 Tax=Dictyostelium purpureum TaxID=5786 RepID=F0ZLS1_DICPU|nr:uncharacterized protein DICPUDRAFT_97997 [Dictyostelium purpureum]EGC35106.1 expressed protein [Dictyostelium purpureum]|eukprot:XP_003288358.1 expressed protein [Dictyostelium purpureum]